MQEGNGCEVVPNLDSFSERQDEPEKEEFEKAAVEILPELAWLKILEMVPLADLYACYQTCMTFQTMLEHRRVSFLLPQILNTLIFSANEEWRLDPLTSRDLLSCRLVSRRWRHGVDEYSQTMPLINNGVFSRRVLPYLFSSSAKVDAFKAVMQGRSQPEENPFVSRNVVFAYEVIDGNREEDVVMKFWRSVVGLVEIYGRQIWHCYLEITEFSSFAAIYDSVLRKLMGLMPNLKTLILLGSFDSLKSNRAARRRAAALVARRPLFRLRNLVNLHALWEEELVQRQLLSIYDPLKLEFLLYSLNFKSCPSELLSLTNLRCLGLTGFKTGNVFTDLKNVRWPLAVLSLELELKKKTIFPAMLDWLNKFGDTLREVSLILSGRFGVETEKADLELRLRLPRLEQLTIETTGRSKVKSIDFILGLNRLKCLSLESGNCFSNWELENPEEKIKFARMWSTMEESNIWELVPKLKLLRIRRDQSFIMYRKDGSGRINKSEFHLDDDSDTTLVDSSDEDADGRMFFAD